MRISARYQRLYGSYYYENIPRYYTITGTPEDDWDMHARLGDLKYIQLGDRTAKYCTYMLTDKVMG